MKIKKYISTSELFICGLNGSIKKINSINSSDEIVFLVLGEALSDERLHKIGEIVSRNAEVYSVQLPGLGDMDEFYNIGKKPSLDNYANFLISLIKLYRKTDKISFIVDSIGLAIVTRSLQISSTLLSRVEEITCSSGYLHSSDLKLSKSKKTALSMFSRALSARLLVFFASILNRHNKTSSYIWGVFGQELAVGVSNGSESTRTAMYVASWMMRLDLCQKNLKVPIHYLNDSDDTVVDKNSAFQHIQAVYTINKSTKSASNTYLAILKLL